MIIYNSKKELIGVDEESLKSLGYVSLVDLQAEATDFSDLFVKKPGFVHNFKHVHWIDFVLCEEDKKACKVIIHAKGKNYNCFLEIKTIYLTSSPHFKSYIINLNNLRVLSSNENIEISNELQTRVTPIATIPIISEIEEEIQEEEIQAIKQPQNIKEIEIKDELLLDEYEPSQAQLDAIGEPDMVETDIYDIDKKEEIIIEKEVKEIAPVETKDENLQSYSFDIEKTAEILEMDIATIEDFINDFINQAKDFKDKLYDSVVQDDVITLKSLSHQLKGVAANLRIHDCEEILIKINRASDFTTSHADLDTFFKLIAKLANEEVPMEVDDIDDDLIIEIDENNSTKIVETELKDDIMLEIEEIEEIEIKDDDLLEIDDFESLDEKQNELIKEIKEDEPITFYDKNKIADEIGLDKESFDELFEDFVDESQDLISVMQTSIDNDDFNNLRHCAVKLKGMSNNMRIDSFTSELETLITSNDKNIAQDALNQIQIELSKILDKKD